MDPASAAPMFCGGITVFSPLVEYGAGTKAKNVGVIGIGGLGHFAVQFASKMGAEVTAISRGDNKKEDAKKLGATSYIATGSDVKKGISGYERTLDLIICTISEYPSSASRSPLRHLHPQIPRTSPSTNTYPSSGPTASSSSSVSSPSLSPFRHSP